MPDDERIQTIEFIDSHTRPDQTLFVGLAKHDTIIGNDNLIYFAAQRLPATRWSEFDPDLQNHEDVQRQMVTLLDEYLHNRYRHVETFGAMSVWRRVDIP